MPAIIVEIRAAEGGEHSKLIAAEQAKIYLKLCSRRGLEVEIIEEKLGMVMLRVVGKIAALAIFDNESGGHRWQMASPTDKQNRVHSSTITVAILPEPTVTQVVLREGDLEYSTMRGSGAGGQHRNVTDSAVVLKHKPSGLSVRCESERSQAQNKETALSVLRARLWQLENDRINGNRADDRRRQLGSGMRGDKRRSVRVQDDSVSDHVTGKQWRFKMYSRGDW